MGRAPAAEKAFLTMASMVGPEEASAIVTVACRGPFARRSRTTPCRRSVWSERRATSASLSPSLPPRRHSIAGEVGAQVGSCGGEGVESARARHEPECGREPVAQRDHRAG
jgi:hypothetical protein